MDKNKKFLSDLIVYSKYAKYIPETQQREDWTQIVDRNKQMHLGKFPLQSEIIERAYKLVYSKKVLPSMRSMQFAGKPIKLNPARLYNCSFCAIDDYRAFSEAFFLLLSGCGFGYSIQSHHVSKLPSIKKPENTKNKRYVVEDSIQGWSDALKMLMKSYFGMVNQNIEFDLSEIRPKGSLLITSGGKAPGPQPLRECLGLVKGILEEKKDGDKLKPIECHSILCHIADAVLAGGIRRASCIALFDKDDTEMLTCKMGNWWELNPHFGRCNNSVVLDRNDTLEEEFLRIWKRVELSRCGEPGISWTNDKNLGFNPCHEISLKSMSFCNLTEINVDNIENEEDIKERVWAATVIGTLQASYTDFYYLREEWSKNSKQDALLGVSLTGIASNEIFNYDIKSLAKYAVTINKQLSEIIGINPAARVTTTKPSGTASLVLGTASGIHAWHDKYYKRRIRINKNESIFTYLQIYHPELLEDDVFRPHDTAVLTIPIKAPEEANTREESLWNFLDRVYTINKQWVANGHISGRNKNNVSATISVRDDEWEKLGEWMWENKDSYSGLSVLPFDGHTYQQAPFESITEDEYNKLSQYVTDFDSSKIFEIVDNTNFQGESACAGGACELK